MKTVIQIQTQPYELVSFEYDEVLEPAEAVKKYHELKEAYKTSTTVGPGLPSKEWNLAVDEYCNTGTLIGGTELYAQMNEKQQFFFQTLKLHNKRSEYKNGSREEIN